MKKVIFTLTVVFLFQVAPLVGSPNLLTHWKIILIIFTASIVWLSQPALRSEEVKANQKTDNLTTWLILAMVALSTILPELEWAYFKTSKDGTPAGNIAGLLFISGGITIRLWAIRTLGRHFTATVQTSSEQPLVTHGPYALIRHPSYLGAYLAIVGSALLLQSWISLAVAALAMFFAYYHRINTEERTLAAHFGAGYVDYQARTRRLLPGIW